MIIKENWIKESKINKSKYYSMYKESLEDNNNFWKREAERINWFKKFTKVKDCKYSNNEVHIKWFEDGNLNVAYNCIDRHAEKNPSDIAIIWGGRQS